MNEQQYQVWWELHRRAAMGAPLSGEEERAYQSGLAALEAEEWAELRPSTELVRPLQEQLRQAATRNRELAQEEAALRVRAAAMENNYRALTGEPLGLEL